ncbi:MAG: hypothetical protein FWE98_05150 [Oscillospiraceae bacterium]|nr:hypothetical protein [Oscillospiraceae bacterium]
MKRVLLLILALGLALSACGRATEAPSEITTTTEAPTTIEPLPDNCQLIKNASSPAIEYFDDQIWWLRGDLTRLSATKFFDTRSADDEHAPQLLLRDETTGEEIVIAEGASFSAPSVQFVIDKRYVVWTDNFKDNGYGGIYDTQRMVNITWGEGAFPVQLHENALWFEPTYYKHREAGPLTLYRVALDRLDTMEKVNLGDNMLEGIPGNDLDFAAYALCSTALSPDCRYYAVRGIEFGIYIFDLQKKALAQQIPPGAIPGSLDNPEPMPCLGFFASPWQNSDHTTLCCYGYLEPDVLEITLP